MFENLNQKGINMNKVLTLVSSVVVGIVMSGCGGGGDSSSAAPSAVLSGTFADAPVAGLDYNCTSGNGTTDTNGTFYYKANDTCMFSLGTFSLGSVKVMNSTVIPADLSDGNSTVTGNIASLLQSLDDHNLSGKINITPAMKSQIQSLGNAGLSVNSDSKTFYSALDDNKTALGLASIIDSAKATVNMNAYLALGISNTIITGKVVNGIDASRITFYNNGIYYAEYLDILGNPNGITGAGTWTSQDGKTIYFTNNISHKTTTAKLISATSATVIAPDSTTYTVTFTQTPITKAMWNGTTSGLYTKVLSIASPGIDPARILFNSDGTLRIAFLSGMASTGTWSVTSANTITLVIAGQSIVITLNSDETGTIVTNGKTYPAVYVLQ